MISIWRLQRNCELFHLAMQVFVFQYARVPLFKSIYTFLHSVISNLLFDYDFALSF